MTVVNFNKFTEIIKVTTYRYTSQNIKTTLLISNRDKKVARLRNLK